MAAPTNATLTSDIRQREDLHRTIEMVTAFETPFFSSIRTGKAARNTYVEYSQETLRDPNADNAAVEGNDVTPRAQNKPTVIGSHAQIFDEPFAISDTTMVVDTIQSESEKTRQEVNAGRAVKQDIEKRMCGNYASVKRVADTTAGKFAGALAWLTTGAKRNTGGADGGWNGTTFITAAATNGTTRALTETLFKDALRASYAATAASRSKVLVTAGNKTIISGFTGIASNTNEVKGNDKVTIVGTADVYVSDVGRHEIILSRHASSRDVLIYSPEKWEKRYVQPFGSKKLAVTGHSEKQMMKVELTLCCLNQAANAVVADLNTTG